MPTVAKTATKSKKTVAKKPAKAAAAGKKTGCTHWSDCGAAEAKCVKNKCVRPVAKKGGAK